MAAITPLEERLAALEAHVARTEKRAGRYRQLSLVLGGLLVTGVLVAANAVPGVDKVLRTERLEIVSPDGTVQVAIGAEANGGQIDVWNNEGRNVLRMWSNPSGGDIALWNSEGRNVFGAYATETGGEATWYTAMGQGVATIRAIDNGASIDMKDDAEQTKVSLTSMREGGTMTVTSDAGNPAALLSGRASGGSLTLNNGAGRPVVLADIDQKGDGLLVLSDKLGQPKCASGIGARGGITQWYGDAPDAVVQIGVSESLGRGFISLSNTDGAQVFAVNCTDDGGGRIDVGNESGNVVFSVDAIKDKGSALAMFNPAGRRMLFMGTVENGGLLNVMNRVGVPVFIAGFGRDGLNGALSIKNARGVQVFQAATEENDAGILRVWDADGRNPRVIRAAPAAGF